MIGHRRNFRRLAPPRRRLRVSVVWLTIGCVLLGSPGCTRQFWRTQADFDTYRALIKKTADPRWDVPRLTVEADPRSRFFDPEDPDCPPLPPDDPAANPYMQYPDGIVGYRSWHKFGQSMAIENPQWLSSFEFAAERLPGTLVPHLQQSVIDQYVQATGGGVPDEGMYPNLSANGSNGNVEEIEPAIPSSELQGMSRFRTPRDVPTLEQLTLEQALELAALHSREYQTALETVYLAALDFTFQAFQFNVRYLGIGGREPTSNSLFSTIPGGTDAVTTGSRFGVSQVLPSGGQWVAELANNTLWLFSGGGRTTSASVLSFSLVQPLLAGGGRKVVLENLTQSERSVLYAVRDLQRFRRTFFSQVASDYLLLMQSLQVLKNQRQNITSLEIQLERRRTLINPQWQRVRAPLAAWPEGLILPDAYRARLTFDPRQGQVTYEGRLTPADYEQLRSLSPNPDFQSALETMFLMAQQEVFTIDAAQLQVQLANQVNALRSSEQAYINQLDQFKLRLGLPTDFQITIDDASLAPFMLIDAVLPELEAELTAYLAAFARLELQAPDPELLRRLDDGLLQLARRLPDDVLRVLHQDLERVMARLQQRRRAAPTPEAATQLDINLANDRKALELIQQRYETTIVPALEAIRESLTSGEPTVAELRLLANALGETREDLFRLVQACKVVQVGLRSELILLPQFNLAYDEVQLLAIENRLDLMNAKARVMDARRRLEVAANQLQAILSVTAEADIGTGPGRASPLDFRGDNSIYRFGLQFTAPLDQVLVRNNYRRALVNYQRARRDYMLLEDTIKASVRLGWRLLSVNRVNFETNRQNVRTAAKQLDLTVEMDGQVIKGAASGQAGTTAGGGQGLNLLNALNGVLGTQNQLIQIWIQAEQARINIYRDMDIMELDERGIWTDRMYQSPLPSAIPPLDEPANSPPRSPREVIDVPIPATDSAASGRGADSAVIGAAYVRADDGNAGARSVRITDLDDGEDFESSVGERDESRGQIGSKSSTGTQPVDRELPDWLRDE